ncbi:hypothetical protein, partial [Burkholderia pseudomallei]
MALVSLGFANCELRKALIYKGLWCADKTPKAALDSTPFGIYVDIAAHCLARPSVRPKERFLCACVCRYAGSIGVEYVARGGVPLCLSSSIIGGFGLVNGAVAQHGEQHVAAT